MSTIELDESKLSEILALIPEDRPIIMLNLLKFNRITNYTDPSVNEECSGQEAYSERYLKNAVVKINEIGGSVIYDGEVCVELIGKNTDNWQRIIVVKYPSIADFMAMVSTDEYQALRVHRAAALSDSRLMATVERA